MPKSKYGHESILYVSVRNDFGVVRQLTLAAFQRQQNRRKRMHIRLIHGTIFLDFPKIKISTGEDIRPFGYMMHRPIERLTNGRQTVPMS